jgi:hypothetical protein
MRGRRLSCILPEQWLVLYIVIAPRNRDLCQTWEIPAALARYRRRRYATVMLPFNVYRCPAGHQTDSFATYDPKLERPAVTEITCKVKDDAGEPCRKRATFIETRRQERFENGMIRD